MRCRVEAGELAAATAWAVRSAPRHAVYPVMTGLHLAAGDGHLTASGYDYSAATQARADAAVLEDGAVLAPRVLHDIAKHLRASEMVELTADGERLTVMAGADRYVLPLLAAHDYPALPGLPEAVGTVDGAGLAERMEQVAAAAVPPRDAAGLAMGAVRMRVGQGVLQLTATNRYAALWVTLPLTGAGEGQALVPAPMAVAGTKGVSGEVELGLEDGAVALSAGGRSAHLRGLAGDFPPVERLLPEVAGVGCIEVEAEELVAAARRVTAVTGTKVRLDVGGDDLTLSAGVSDDTAATATVPATVIDLDGMVLAVDVRYLTLGLKPISARARLWISSPGRPVLIRPADDLEGATLQAMVMPLKER